MDKIRANKAQLVERITENREKHRKVFEEAMDGYRDQAIGMLDSYIAQLKAGKNPMLYVNLPVPQDHTKDYDAVLDMLALSLDDEIVIDQRAFRSYVRDEWDWKREFIATASNYTAAAE